MTTPKPSKRFYSVLDVGFIGEVPQSIQHLVIGNMADRAGGRVIFYTMEDYYTRATHEVIQAKLEEKPEIEGIVFFRIAQFFYSSRPSFSVLDQLVSTGLECHFARERISIRTRDDLKRIFPMLFVVHDLEKRDRSHDYFTALLASASLGR